jgi:hypothetical protein
MGDKPVDVNIRQILRVQAAGVKRTPTEAAAAVVETSLGLLTPTYIGGSGLSL